MNRKSLAYTVVGAVAVAAAGGLLLARSFSAGETTLAELARETHFHGIAIDSREPSGLYIATHHGLYAVGSDGKAVLISETRDDFMGFTPHPSDPAILYASGHPEGGGNLGFITSPDAGRSWTKLSDGIGGPVDFHQMDVSKADPTVIYGVYGDLQRSTDGGRTWIRVGPAPEGIIGLAASSRDADTLYAATQGGLLRSTDGGRSWQPAHVLRRPASVVHVTRQGKVYAFIVGSGLVRANEEDMAWQEVNNGFDTDYLVHLAADPDDGRPLYAVSFNPQTRRQAVLASRDGGKSWLPLGNE